MMARHAILIKIMQEQTTSKKVKDDSKEQSLQNEITSVTQQHELGPLQEFSGNRPIVR